MSKNNRPKFQKRLEKPSARVKSKEVVMTVLDHGEESNLLTWQKCVLAIGGQKYGVMVTNVIKNSDYQLPEPPNIDDYAHLVEAYGVAQFQADIKEYQREFTKLSGKKAEFFWFMWAHMSPESMDAVKRRPNFDEFEGRDPLALWLAIKETHGINETYQDEVMMRMDLRKKLNETQEEELNQADVSMDFFDGLCEEPSV
mmetsp:Transcript_16522/g.27588  ORF Transcript_16522/g.27588 Transcript_16522/m.27588 type:complete len:199 (+) Transcript_16522:194-790(+)|eukprot:CAMPEP_0114429352 /NCGR_PEP_ID=MMETSP0103-20121206/9437_1 /TAXON_ID=37642 ORGANISM="Paraphysomonas imperforata, Strain PA2" /NCGR_SAMPLE_ID=MMETSP0103 /ASSEMBLY_ACC=CAM_ASM_000201 /LENGTH=198 /DNA_ID=CAMNT_0001598677 /DNA_START=468 /DNA_END=1064 /DNA_ORIENTATION=+